MPFMALMPLSGTSCSIHIGIPASVAIPKMWRGMKRCEEIYRDVSLTYPANAVVSEWGQSLQCDKFKRARERGNKKNQIIEIESTIPFAQLLCACSSGQVANDFLRLTGTASLFSLVAASCPLCALASCFASWLFETMVASCHISSPTLSSICIYLSCIETYWNILKLSLIIFDLSTSCLSSVGLGTFSFCPCVDPLPLALSHLSTRFNKCACSPLFTHRALKATEWCRNVRTLQTLHRTLFRSLRNIFQSMAKRSQGNTCCIAMYCSRCRDAIRTWAARCRTWAFFFLLQHKTCNRLSQGRDDVIASDCCDSWERIMESRNHGKKQWQDLLYIPWQILTIPRIVSWELHCCGFT